MNGDIIKSFLVSLGFGVDDSSLARFNKAIASASLRVSALYASIKIATAGIFFGISKISDGFEKLGYELRLVSPPITKVLQLRKALIEAYTAAGIDIKKAAQQSIIFNFSLAKTKFVLEAIYKSVGLKFIPLLTKQMDIFRKQIYANMPRIQRALEKFVAFIFKAFEATTILGARVWKLLEGVYDFFKKLHDATDGWSTIILGVVAAWKLLNLSFIATPIGALLTGLVALLALWDDFKTFKEGGKSLFNWGPVIPYINALVKAMTPLVDLVQSLFGALWKLIHSDFSGAFDELEEALDDLTEMFSNLWDFVKGLSSEIGSHLVDSIKNVGSSIAGFFTGSPNVAQNVQNNPASAPLVNPIGSNVNNNTSQQSLSQETNIIVQGSADASSTGKAIAGEQSRVNFDLARNMKGATR